MKQKDYIGKTWGRLTVIKDLPREKERMFLVKCSCGNINKIRQSQINRTQSCGCLSAELLAKGMKPKTHGLSGTRFQNVYYQLKYRCESKKSPAYKNYGGRGIKNEWKSFIDFKNDMYDSYIEKSEEFGETNISIDRKNNNGNYNKKNCHWVTMTVQANNKRNNRLITIDGETKTIRQWSEEKNIPFERIRKRIYEQKWDDKKAVLLPKLNTNGRAL